MDILTEQQHRALAFIASATRSGYAPTPDELNVYLRSPSPRRTGGIVGLSLMAAAFHENYMGQAEDTATHLVRLRWLSENDHGRLRLSDLGRALLRDAEVETTEVQTVVLNADDPLAYAQLIGELAGMGLSMIVDPYLDVQGLSDLISRTSFSRILVSDKDPKKLAALGTYLQNLKESPDIRFSTGNMHDRVILAEDGAVWTIGASLNTVKRQKATTILMPVPRAGVDGMRETYEDLWRTAQPLLKVDDGTGSPEDETATRGAPAPS